MRAVHSKQALPSREKEKERELSCTELCPVYDRWRHEEERVVKVDNALNTRLGSPPPPMPSHFFTNILLPVLLWLAVIFRQCTGPVHTLHRVGIYPHPQTLQHGRTNYLSPYQLLFKVTAVLEGMPSCFLPSRSVVCEYWEPFISSQEVYIILYVYRFY